jgi:YD repeat-containing protein
LSPADSGYDTGGRLTSATRLAGTPDAVTTGFTYTTMYDQLASVTDALNQTTAFGYDALGRLTTVTDPLGHETRFTYNMAGQPLTAANHCRRRSRSATTAGIS